MGTLPQDLKIIFEVQWKRNNEKKQEKKNYKTFFSFSFLFEPLLLSNLITFF